MAILPHENREEVKQVIDINGPQGNAFFLMGTAGKLAKQLDLNTDKIIEEMKAGDYENLLDTFDSYFGDYVDLQR